MHVPYRMVCVRWAVSQEKVVLWSVMVCGRSQGKWCVWHIQGKSQNREWWQAIFETRGRESAKGIGKLNSTKLYSLGTNDPQWGNGARSRGNKVKIHLFAGRAVKRERRNGSSRRQQPAYGAAVNEVAHELLRSARSPNRENGGRRYIKHDGMIASPVGSCLCCWQLPVSPPVSPLYCSAPHCPPLSLSLFDQVWCIQRCDCVNCT